MKAKAIPFVVLTGFFALGYGMIMSTADQYAISRDPAAIRQVYDFSHLRGDALDGAMKERMMAGLELYKDSEQVGFGMGHFTFVNEKGEKTLACREYGKMLLSFEAEGVVVNGERPSMELEGECKFSEDLGKIQPLYLPVARILGEKPADGEFQFRETNSVAVRFSNLSDEWPRRWVLIGVTLVGSQNKVSIQRNELKRLLGHHFIVNIDTKTAL